MEIKEAIEKGFISYVNKTFKSENVRTFLLRHERKYKFFSNMEKQILGCSHIIFKYSSVERRRETLKVLIETMSAFFCRTAIDVKEGELTNGEKIKLGDIIKERDKKEEDYVNSEEES